MSTKFGELTKGMAQSVTRRQALKKFGLGFVTVALASSLLGSWPANGASFLITGSLNDARAYHTATFLPSGKVLVAGGYFEDDDTQDYHYLNGSELYDPATGTWALTGDLNKKRAFHTASLLADGKVLVTGGENDNSDALGQSEIYDGSSGTWTKTETLKIGREYHTATLLANGKVLVAGGYGPSNVLFSAEIYDPVTGKWAETGSLAHARYLHTATLLDNGQVLVAGGSEGTPASSGGIPLDSVEIYDPVTGEWTEAKPLNTRRVSHTATLLPNGNVLVAGGETGSVYGYGGPLASAELYDPTTASWTYTGSMVTLSGTVPGRFDHTASLLPNGQVLVIGGKVIYGGVFGSPGPIPTVELYDPATGAWSDAGRVNELRGDHTATLLPDGDILVTGGWGLTPYYFGFHINTINSAELYAGTGGSILSSPRMLPDGAFQFSFTSVQGAVFNVFATTNLTSSAYNWDFLGVASEGMPGQFQFTDSQARNHPQRFYRVRSP